MRVWLVWGALLLALAIISGAFGSHALQSRLTADQWSIYQTAVRYHLIHGLGLILIGVLGFQVSPGVVHIPATLILVGTLIFSGNLYLLVLTDLKWLGAITPVGGLAMMGGWLLLTFNVWKHLPR